MLKEWWNQIKDWWNRQPEIVVYQPIRINSNPEPIPFELKMQGQTKKGRILRIDEIARVITKRGDSFEISIPIKWPQHLPPKMKPMLIQMEGEKDLSFIYRPERG